MWMHDKMSGWEPCAVHGECWVSREQKQRFGRAAARVVLGERFWRDSRREGSIAGWNEHACIRREVLDRSTLYTATKEHPK